MKPAKPRKPAKTWKRTYKRDPWNNPETKLELYISPTLQLRLGPPRRPISYLEKPREESEEKA